MRQCHECIGDVILSQPIPGKGAVLNAVTEFWMKRFAGIIPNHSASEIRLEKFLTPDEISLLDIVEVIDGPIELNECVADRSLCALGDNCPVRAVWCNAQAELVDRLMRTNFGRTCTFVWRKRPRRSNPQWLISFL